MKTAIVEELIGDKISTVIGLSNNWLSHLLKIKLAGVKGAKEVTIGCE